MGIYTGTLSPEAWAFGYQVVIQGGWIVAAGLGCDRTPEEIVEIEALADAGVFPSSLPFPPGEVSPFDLTVGDCSSDALGGSIESVKLVECSSPEASARVTKLFTVGRSGALPDMSYFEEQMDLNCPMQDDWYLHPNQQSWSDGDRTITCLRSLR